MTYLKVDAVEIWPLVSPVSPKLIPFVMQLCGGNRANSTKPVAAATLRTNEPKNQVET